MHVLKDSNIRMMENHFTQKVSRFFPSSFTSCRFKTVADVVHRSISATRNRHENQSSRNQFPKINLDEDDDDDDGQVSRDLGYYASKDADKKATLVLGYFSPSIDGRRCPPATPISAVAPQINPAAAEPTASSCTTSSISGETHRESDTLFSFSSAVSSASFRSGREENGKKNEELSQEDQFDYYSDVSGCRRKTSKPRRKTTRNGGRRRRCTASWCAIEKSTSDPYGEFRKSMMEMIVEKQMFRAEDLNALLHCFLSLNSPFFHEVIVEVYLEIIETLFTN